VLCCCVVLLTCLRSYQDYICKTTGTDDGLPPSNKPFLVMERQRRHLEKTLSSMSTSLSNAEKRRQSEGKQSLNRNTLLLTEVNELREQNKKLEMRCKHLMVRPLLHQCAVGSCSMRHVTETCPALFVPVCLSACSVIANS
jgi:hypothetical protein